MKRFNLWMPIAVLICSFLMTGLCSCDDIADNPSTIYAKSKDIGYDVKNVKVVESGDFTISEIVEDILVDHEDMDTDDDFIYTEWGKEQLNNIQAQEKATTRSGEGLDGESGESKMGMRYVTIRYKTTGADGKETELSELIAYDKNACDKDFTNNPKNLSIACN